METIIKGEMIKWARERAGLSPESLAEKLQINSDKVRKWESGEVAIPISKAKALSKISLIPYGLLFADNPPEEKITIPDFRTHGSVGLRKPSPELLETINDAKLKQEWYKEYLISEDFKPLEFIGNYNTDFDPEFIATELKNILRIDETEYLKCQDWEAAFTYLINHFVMPFDVLGGASNIIAEYISEDAMLLAILTNTGVLTTKAQLHIKTTN